ncbi:CPBP family intramembrane glutamic endopeptidase [Butyrivibrio sp. AE3006]|uniref:CPBP family intramembrane glutamic endopeptidase n=1 Tax=Butyrivibrio sp. AE3006 TaxID=1280673 RepID=UPI000407111E|nr:type II CAAX endopeptidase family protein [Butyrivibrio sp. AE3006]
MKEVKYSRKSLITFFLLVIGFSAIWETVYIMGGPEWAVAVLMWVPAFSAFIAAIVNIREKGEKFSFKKTDPLMGIKCCKIGYVFLGILIPFIYLFIPYRIYWTMHPENFGYTGVSFAIIMKDLAVYSIVMVLVSMMTATGEELGWRGFMLPALLERMDEKKAMLAVGLFWGAWHLPILVSGGYMDGTSLGYRVVAFMLHIIPVAIISAILAIKSGSVWPSAFLHASHNAFDQAVFQAITIGDDKMYYVSETGVFTIICAWVIAIVMYVIFVRTQSENAAEKGVSDSCTL